jgi:hypothetical protein
VAASQRDCRVIVCWYDKVTEDDIALANLHRWPCGARIAGRPQVQGVSGGAKPLALDDHAVGLVCGQEVHGGVGVRMKALAARDDIISVDNKAADRDGRSLWTARTRRDRIATRDEVRGTR